MNYTFHRGPAGPETNVPHVITRHSPTGFEWGYGGSGPADLALNLTIDVIKKMGRKYQQEGRKIGAGDAAGQIYQDVKWSFIAHLPHKRGTIEYETIAEFVAARLQALSITWEPK